MTFDQAILAQRKNSKEKPEISPGVVKLAILNFSATVIFFIGLFISVFSGMEILGVVLVICGLAALGLIARYISYGDDELKKV
jgi:hypothetical protein